jgi:molybdenum cofactor biosynthesis enzyme MoaA
MTDSFGRDISYLRVSVTDRCNFRCAYCMSDDVEFLPRRDLLTMQELDRLCSAFVDRGVRKIRITGGEPLDRLDLTLIELMPLGIGAQSDGRFLPLSQVRTRLEERFTLKDLPDRTGGPARYVRIAETGGRLGFITPLSQHFCASCNRVRVTCTGQLFTCLGQEGSAELRHPLRASESDYPLLAAIDSALAHKPAGHNFIDRQGFTAPSLARHMSTTGG